MKLDLGKSILKGLRTGVSAAAATAVATIQSTGNVDVHLTGIVGAICGLIRALANVVKIVRSIKRGEVG